MSARRPAAQGDRGERFDRPPERKRAMGRGLLRGLALGPGQWAAMARCVAELARANRRLRLVGPAELLRDLREAPADDAMTEAIPLDPAQAHLLERVAYLVPRVAAHVPWRADCLVQALAAQRWLAQAGIVGRIELGVKRDDTQPFAAHAWLRVGARTVTGAVRDPYVRLARRGD